MDGHIGFNTEVLTVLTSPHNNVVDFARQRSKYSFFLNRKSRKETGINTEFT